MTQEYPYLQLFCRFAEYKDELSFDALLMVYFRKRPTLEILGEINEYIVELADIFKVSTDYLLGVSIEHIIRIDILTEAQTKIIYSLLEYFAKDNLVGDVRCV